MRRILRPLVTVALVLIMVVAHALSPSEVFITVKDSVLVIRTLDSSGRAIAQGSGVQLPNGKIGTNCHVLKGGSMFQVGVSKKLVSATLWGGDEDQDICLLEASGLKYKPVQLGQAMSLKVGEPVYAVGAPKGLELSLSNGIVTQLRGGPPPFIQTNAAISPGSSGGGLFDLGGRLVGLTTMYIEGGQSLNFAMPIEWVQAIERGSKVAKGRAETDWMKRSLAFEAVKDWSGLLDWSKRWTLDKPTSASAWFSLGKSNEQLENFSEAIDALRKAIQFEPGSAGAWALLAITYCQVHRPQECLDAAQQSIRIEPSGGAWWAMGSAYHGLGRYSDAIDAFRQRVTFDPPSAPAWGLLAVLYLKIGDQTAGLEALRQMRYIDPALADNLSSSLLASPVK